MLYDYYTDPLMIIRSVPVSPVHTALTCEGGVVVYPRVTGVSVSRYSVSGRGVYSGSRSVYRIRELISLLTTASASRGVRGVRRGSLLS